MGDLVFDLSPTQSAFVHTDAHIAMLMGPMGEGKTYCGVAACMRHAERCGMNIRGALIRDGLLPLEPHALASLLLSPDCYSAIRFKTGT